MKYTERVTMQVFYVLRRHCLERKAMTPQLKRLLSPTKVSSVPSTAHGGIGLRPTMCFCSCAHVSLIEVIHFNEI